MTTRIAGAGEGSSGNRHYSEHNAVATPSFQHRLSQHEHVTLIEIHGDVEDDDKAAFREVLFQTIQNDAPGKRCVGTNSIDGTAGDIALNLSEVGFLSEEAVAILIHALKAQKARGALLRLVRPSPWVRKKLERTAVLWTAPSCSTNGLFGLDCFSARFSPTCRELLRRLIPDPRV